MQKILLTTIFLLTALHLMAQKRVVSLSPSITYTIVQLGAENTIVGRTSYCPETDGSVIVGDVLTTNIESIIALKPDVVFSMAFTQVNVINKLRSLGIEVVNFNTPSTFDEIAITTLKIGKHIGEPGKTQTYLSNELNNIKALKEAIAEKLPMAINPYMPQNSKTAMFQIGANPLWVVTPNTYMNEYLTTLGIYNIVKTQNGQINREFVITERPNIIFISDMGDTGLADTEAEQWKKLIPNCKTVIIDANKSCCPTPQFYRETLETMYKAITE